MHLLYLIFVYLYLAAIKIASLFNTKAKKWCDGRKNIFEKLQSALSSDTSSKIWFHCASLGEFEQGRPIIEKLKKQNPNTKIVLTFFSPSGYEIRKNYEGVDYIFYLPLDTIGVASKFLQIVNPKAVFFVKYEFWFGYLNQLKIRNIPTYLVSGIFRENQHFFKSYGAWFRMQLMAFTHFYLQDKNSEKLLNTIGFKNTTVSGDTRFDRVFEISKVVQSTKILDAFCANKAVFIAGSTWAEDEKIIVSAIDMLKQYKLIIAPHEIDEKHIDAIIQSFGSKTSIVRYSQLTDNSSDALNAHVLIIDNIGMLSSLYQYGTIAYVGGGFGKGIHNVLEPATFGLPIIIGPNYKKFAEAVDLIGIGAAFSIHSDSEFNAVLNNLAVDSARESAASISKKYVQSKIGATEIILASVQLNQ